MPVGLFGRLVRSTGSSLLCGITFDGIEAGRVARYTAASVEVVV
jgi:hypothetical protein